MDIEKNMGAIKRIARRLASPGSDIYDDLVQEMCVAIIEAGDGHKKSFYLKRARSRAIDYMKSRKNYYFYDKGYRRVQLPSMWRQL